ncbi:MAG: DNA recombination protein RmuC [Lewinellaceae bacterium]|jgi:DNA recombination protein RmuC|nr:DNA recombination protein RmuC [Lewinellaceae bacterium]
MDPVFYIMIGGVLLALFLFLILRQQAQTPGGASDRANVVSKELYDAIHAQNGALQSGIATKEQELRDAHAQLAAREQQIYHLENTLKTQKAEVEQLQSRFKTEFENIANRLLEEKSQRFTEQNALQMQSILSPLKEKIKEFGENVDRKFLEETREKSSLKKELEQLYQLNQQLSQDAHNLASALKGQSKMQGDWGEMQLEMVLEKSGLQKGIHFVTQATFRDDDGAAKRPDFIIQLPENKHLIVDSKVSLTAFERYFNAVDPSERDQHLKAHITSIRSHVDNLSRTNYQMLYQVNTPDYLLLFVPLESALSVASQADPKLFTDALERNIVLVTTSSLLATMRTVAHMWKQEKQTRSVLEIARQSGLLYDKFVAFVEDIRTIGARLDNARSAYDDAMNKLVNASRPGDTLIGKAEKIRELGARATKSLPQELIEE